MAGLKPPPKIEDFPTERSMLAQSNVMVRITNVRFPFM